MLSYIYFVTRIENVYRLKEAPMQVNRSTNVAPQRTYQVACQPGVLGAESAAPQAGRVPDPLVIAGPSQEIGRAHV